MKILLIPIFFLVVGLFPTAFADVFPLPEIDIFDDANQSWCYQELALNSVILDGDKTKTTEIQNIVEI